MEDKLQILYNNLVKEGYELPDYDTFKVDMSDEAKSKKLHDSLMTEGYELPDYDTFLGDMGLKKKFASGQVSATASQGSSIPQPPLESAKETPKDRQTTVIGDLIRSYKSAAFRALGGIVETPMFLSKTIASLTIKPIAKSMGATEEEANQVVDYAISASKFGQGEILGEETQKVLITKAQKTEAKMTPIEGNIAQNIKEGDWGQAGELLGRGVMQSLPYLAMTATTAGGGSVAVLGTIGATSSAQQYGENEGRKESKRLLNAWMYGGFEAAGELVTAGLLRGVGKSFRQGMTKQVEKKFAQGVAKGIAKDVGLEGSSEAVTQIGQNFTDIVTGVDPERSIFDGVIDAFLIGAVAGGGIGTVQGGASLLGRTLATDKEVTEVQDNVNQQSTLIDQIETTDKDPVKSALDKRLRTLKYEADKIMDKNYELAKTLSPEQANTVAELYSVWNELQAKIDNKELVTEQEITTTEKAIEGAKAEIEGIKEAKIAELSEIKKEGAKFKIGDKHFETQEAVEAWLDKNYVKHGLEPVWHEPTEKVIDNWVKQNKDKIEQKYTEKLQEEQKLKKEEETKDAQESRIANQEVIEQGTPGLEQQEADVSGVRNNEQVEPTKEKVVTGIKDLEQKESFDCGICALRTVLAKYGIEATEDALISETKPTKEEGVPLSAIVENARDKGLDAEWKQGMTPQEIRDNIDNDTPVIILQNGVGETDKSKDYKGNDDGHYITIKGYDKEGFLFEDPSAEGKNLKMTEQELLERWHGYLDDGETVAEGIGIVIKKPVQKTETFTEREQPVKENNIFNKQQVIESLLTEVPEESRDMMRTEFGQLERDEFNKMAEQAGFNNFGSHWTRETIAKESVKPPEAPKEAILDTQAQSEGGIPTTPQEPLKTQEKGQEGQNEREKGFYKRLNESSTPSQDLKDAIKEKGLTYTVLNNNITQANIDFVISELGLEKAWEQCKDKGSALNGATRSGLSERLVVHYDKLASEAEKAGDLENEELYRNKALEIAEWKDDYGRDAGQFNQYSGSDECTRLMSPKTNVVRVKRSITKQREKKIESNKEDVKEKKDAMRKANKESADELVKSKEFEDLKRKVAELEAKLTEKKEPKPPKDIPKDKVAKIKKEIEDEWARFKKAGKTSASATIIGLNAEQIEALGNIVAKYIQLGVYKTEELLVRLKKDYFKHTGKILSDEDARKALPDKVDGKTLAEIEKEGEAKELAENLKEKVRKLLEDPKIPKDDPIKQLLDTLFQKIEEKDTAEKPAKEKKPTIEKIRQAIEDKERYADVWEKAKEKVLFMIDTNPELTEEQKSDQKKRLQSFFDEVIGKPYSEKQTEKATREKIKEEGVDIDKVVKQHYTVLDATGRTLAEKLVEDAGVSGEQATMLAEAIQKQFNKIATERKKNILLRGLKARAKALTEPKKAKLEWEKLIELTNLGAFTSAEFAEAYAEIWGFPKLTNEQAKEIERLAGIIQTKDGFKKDEAVRDYLNYLANIPGIDLGEIAMGWWYASILSGERTQFKNFFGNLTNTIFEATIGTIYNLGKGDFKTAQAMWAGLLGASSEAMTEFRYTLATGYSPVRYNKIEAAQVLERWTPKSWLHPVQYAKYVGRFMSATDAFFYIGLKEMRAHELAMREARKLNADAGVPSAQDWAKATELLFGTKQREAEAKLQVEQEGLTGIAKKKRIWELMERSRGEAIVTESNNFASHGTYNYRPEGGLGMITEAIGRTVGGMEMSITNPFTGKKYTIAYGKFFVPFTRIIANVGNTALDYTPVGIKRGVSGRIGSPRKAQYYRELTSEERARTLIKAVIGTSTAMILWFLSEPPDDGEEPVVQITAKGTGDYAKNQELAKSPNGWQQYSIKIGGTWYSYQYTPLFLILAPLGFIRDTQTYKKDKASTMKAIDVAVGGLSMFMSALSDMTALTTTSGLLETISSGDIPTTVAFWKKMSSSTVKGFIYPKAVEQTKQMINDFNDDPQRYSSSLLGKMVKDMPGMKNYFPVQYNSFGEQASFDAVQMMERPKTDDPVAKYVVDNEAFIGTPDQRGDACIIYDSKLGVERGMNDDEYMRFVQTSGREIKNRIREDLMPRTDLTPEEIKKEITNIKTAVRKQAKAILFGWTKLRSEHPEDWNTFIETEAVPVPQESVEVDVNDKKTRLSDEQLDEFNEKAIEYYRQGIIGYLKDTATITRDKKDIDNDTGESYFNGEIAEEWRKAKQDAKDDMENKLNNK